MNISPSVSTVTSINCYILIVIMITEIPLSCKFIKAVSDITFSFCMPGITWLMRNIKLISYSIKQIMISTSVYHWSIKVFLRNRKMCSCRISYYSNSKSFGFCTEKFFISFSSSIYSKNSITIVIYNFVSIFSSWIYIFI